MQSQKSNKMWGGRFEDGSDMLMQAINASIGFDQKMAEQDIAGSQAHAEMLRAQGILTAQDEEAIQYGLRQILEELRAGKFEFQVELEDIHMNVEARLKDLIGEPAGWLHTARSRNDQVANDFRLWVRDHYDLSIDAITALMRTLWIKRSRVLIGPCLGLPICRPRSL